TTAGGCPSVWMRPWGGALWWFSSPPMISRAAPGSTVKKLMVVLGRSNVAVPVWIMTVSIGEFGAEPLFQLASEIGQAPVPFQIKTVEGGSVGAFAVAVSVFGSSPPMMGIRGRELNIS